MKRQGVTQLLILLWFLSLSFPATAASDGIYSEIHLDFFNLFHPATPHTEAFQRYHSLTAGYRYNHWQGQLTYNWYDRVDGAVSTHTLTPWGLEASYHFDRQHFDLSCWWVTDLTDSGHASDVLRVRYSRSDSLSRRWTLETHIGVKLINRTMTSPLLGGTLQYREQFRIGLNNLDPIDDLLLNDSAFSLHQNERSLSFPVNDGVLSSHLPVNIGYTYRFNPYAALRLDYYQFLLPPVKSKCDRWLRTEFSFTLW